MSGSNTTMSASLILRLQDRLSAGLGGLKQRLDGIRASAERIGALGAIGSGLAIGAPIAAAARFDDVLRGIAITAALSGTAAEKYIAKLRREFQKLALETGQTSEAVAAAAGLMIQRGLPADLIDKLLPVSARVATAASADIKDIAGVVESVNTALGVMPAQLDTAMSMLIVAAKEGKVELKDMAREFPALAAAANNFGLKGMDGVKVLAASLQVAAKASATPAEAANNLSNLFQSLTRPETMKNFAKMGVDFPKVIRDAQAKGINPMEAAIAKVFQLTRGDPFKLGALIGDLQAGRALLPFLRDAAKEYLRIRGVVGGATPEVISTDFETRMRGPAIAMARAAEILTQLQERFGRELFGRVDLVVAPLDAVLKLLAKLDEMAPDLVGNMLRFLAAFLALITVLGVAITVLPVLAAGFRVITGVLRLAFIFVPLLVQGFTALAAIAGGIAAPILAIVAVIALVGAIAYTIWANWSEFQDFFWAMWMALRRVLNGFIVFLDGVFSLDMDKIITGLKVMWGGLKDFFIELWGVLSKVMDIWVDGASAWVAEKVVAVVEKFKAAWSGVQQWFTELWDRLAEPINRWIDRITGLLDRLRERWRALPATPEGAPDPTGMAPLFNPTGYTPPAGAAGQFIRAPMPPAQRVELTIQMPPGTTAEARVPDAWTARTEEVPQYRGRVQDRI